MARRILGGEFGEGSTVTVDLGTDGGLTFNGSPRPQLLPDHRQRQVSSSAVH